jgi:uncharacterized heparinase superfamily protein
LTLLRPIRQLLILLNTVRYLKLQQIYFRFVRALIKPRVTEIFQGSIPERLKEWKHLTLFENKIDSQLEACFLNYTKKLDLPADWNNELPSKLWVYNLNYFEDLLSENACEKHDFHLKLLNNWITNNPVGYGNGWEPYPTSLRIVNILKAWFGGLDLDKKIFSSIFEQASYLSSNLEKHLLGNHYFVNLKALLFAGVVFNNFRWLSIAEKGLISEIPEQILDDGANFELSPMYHSLMLVDMLDMFNLYRTYPTKISNNLASLLEKYIPKMLTFMEAMAHPDGGVSFFNDSSEGIAPTKSKIESYAEILGFAIRSFDSSKMQLLDNVESGYFCATVGGNKLIFDASPVGPDYIPGHAHADTLSFELSIGKQRVFVNSGISEYGISQNRLNQRKTASHNTVEVDCNDSSQVWSGFRVGRRAQIIEKKQKLISDGSVYLSAAHDGYRSLFFGCIHKRALYFNEKSIIVVDELIGNFTKAKSRFHFHPELNVTLTQGILMVIGRSFYLRCNLKDKNASLSDSLWHPQFGIDIPNKLLVLDIISNKTEIIFEWQQDCFEC